MIPAILRWKSWTMGRAVGDRSIEPPPLFHRNRPLPKAIPIWPQASSPAIRYGFSAMTSLFGFLIAYLLFPFFLSPVFFLSFVAVMVSALYGGWGPGLLATLLSGGAYLSYFIPLIRRPDHPVSALLRIDVFFTFSLLTCWISASFRSAYRALSSARIQAEEASRYRSKLIANVSHDLRTPLS